MLESALIALAAASGSAVVQAARTDAWSGLRDAVARWFGRGDAEQGQAELARLEETATALALRDPSEAERARIRQEALWQARIEARLEGLDEQERAHAVAELHALLALHAGGAVTSAGPGGLAARDVSVHADNQSIAAAVLHGGARIDHNPTQPDPSQG